MDDGGLQYRRSQFAPPFGGQPEGELDERRLIDGGAQLIMQCAIRQNHFAESFESLLLILSFQRNGSGY